jgi:hypothetical protein
VLIGFGVAGYPMALRGLQALIAPPNDGNFS